MRRKGAEALVSHGDPERRDKSRTAHDTVIN